MKKFIALLSALVLMLSFAACGKKEPTNEGTTYEEQIAADELQDLEEELFGTSDSNTEAPSDNGDETSATNALSTETVTNDNGETVTQPITEATTAAQSNVLSDNPAEWSKDQIIKYYKYAAAKSSSVTSKKTMEMKELTVNGGDGVLATFVDMATPLLKDALADNSTEFMGITGGYGKLEPSDVQTAKAYKSGNYTIIEMTLVEQVDGAHGQEKEGTVGHGISVVGDLAIVEENLPMFDIDFENADIKIRYSNPTIKVKINNQTHQIEKGTWSYDVKVDIANLFIQNKKIAAFKADIKSGNGEVTFKVTVGGGF